MPSCQKNSPHVGHKASATLGRGGPTSSGWWGPQWRWPSRGDREVSVTSSPHKGCKGNFFQWVMEALRPTPRKGGCGGFGSNPLGGQEGVHGQPWEDTHGCESRWAALFFLFLHEGIIVT